MTAVRTLAPERSEVKSLRKALDILTVVALAEHALSVPVIAKRAGVARPTGYRIVQTLLAAGFLKEDAVTGAISIGYSALPLAASVLDRDRFRLEAMPHLEQVAHTIGERVNLGVIYNDRVLYLAGIEKPSLPSIYSRFGRTVPANCSSLGKAVLAQYSTSELNDFLDRVPFVSQTEHSICDRVRFVEELDRVREQGYAYDLEENALGSFCMGVPIFARGKVIGAISVSTRSLSSLSGVETTLGSAAEQISHKLSLSAPD